MNEAYGANLITSADGDHDSVWCTCWRQLVQHSSNHYILPSGSTGHKYVDVLTEEVTHLAVGNYPSEDVLAFSSVVLQRDRMVRKGTDVRHLFKQHILLWREKFDLLVQEAAQRNQAFGAVVTPLLIPMLLFMFLLNLCLMARSRLQLGGQLNGLEGLCCHLMMSLMAPVEQLS